MTFLQDKTRKLEGTTTQKKDLNLTTMTQLQNNIEISSKQSSTNKNIPARAISIEAFSGSRFVKVTVNGSSIFEASFADNYNRERGTHVVTINQYNGLKMAHKRFDTFFRYEAAKQLIEHLEILQIGRIIVMMALDEASFGMDEDTRRVIQSHGSRFITKLGYRDTWVFAFKKGYLPLSEDLHEGKDERHGDLSRIRIQGFVLDEDTRKCSWAEATKSFCNSYEGYGNLCNCLHPLSLDLAAPDIPGSRVDKVPIVVIASNRPGYLYRMLTQLLQTPGVKRYNVNVFIDGPYQETMDVASLLGVFYKQNTHLCDSNCGVSQNYKSSLTYIFDKNPKANHVIIFEEDLSVSPDIMDYFSQLLPVLDEDESLFCISAWNDQGYTHSSNDPKMLYRTETMPGLGWILKRKIYKEELESDWPKDLIWDFWVRSVKLNNRECIIPDISRTFHFGTQGVNMNEYIHQLLFKTHALNKETGLKFDVEKVKKDNYEKELHRLISSAEVLNRTKSPCKDNDFIPNTVGRSYVAYIKYSDNNDYETWNNIAKCLKLFAFDARGRHKRMFRLWLKKNMVFFVGSTSPYAIYKPKYIEPLYIKKVEWTWPW